MLDLSLCFSDANTIEMGAFVYDANGELQYITDRKKIDSIKGSQIQAYITSFDFVIKSESVIEVRVVIAYISLDFNRKKFTVLSDVEMKGESNFESPALVIYFADKNERLWDIAKTFKTSVELIKKENEITKDFCETSRVLIIPGV